MSLTLNSALNSMKQKQCCKTRTIFKIVTMKKINNEAKTLSDGINGYLQRKNMNAVNHFFKKLLKQDKIAS